MATNYKPSAAEIEKQFVDLFYGKYMAGQWGITAGYAMVPDYYAVMRMQLVTWQLGMDCDNSLCTEARTSTASNVVSLCSGTGRFPVENPCCPVYATFQSL